MYNQSHLFNFIFQVEAKYWASWTLNQVFLPMLVCKIPTYYMSFIYVFQFHVVHIINKFMYYIIFV